MDDAFAHIIDKLIQKFDGSLKTAWHPRSRLPGGAPQQERTNDAEHDGKKDCIKIDKREVGDILQALTFADIIQTGKTLQMVLDIVGSTRRFTCHNDRPSEIVEKPDD